MFHLAKLTPPEVVARDNATLFVASAFRGRGRYDRIETATLDDAIHAATELYEGDRGVTIHAYDSGGRHAILGAWDPKRKIVCPA